MNPGEDTPPHFGLFLIAPLLVIHSVLKHLITSMPPRPTNSLFFIPCLLISQALLTESIIQLRTRSVSLQTSYSCAIFNFTILSSRVFKLSLFIYRNYFAVYLIRTNMSILVCVCVKIFRQILFTNSSVLFVDIQIFTLLSHSVILVDVSSCTISVMK